MRVLQGKGVSGGLAMGRLVFYKRKQRNAVVKRDGDPAVERARFAAAQEAAAAQLLQLAARAREQEGPEAAMIFETHAMLAQDITLIQSVYEALDREHCNAEYALKVSAETFAAMFDAMEDAYMRERAADIRDVTGRILDRLMGCEEENFRLTEPVILAADDLAPSETIGLDPALLLGFLTQQGADNSHTAILARTMGIPAICRLGEGLAAADEGSLVCMDGGSGELILDPDRETAADFEQRMDQQAREKAQMVAVRGLADETRDGRRIRLYANAGSLKDVAAAVSGDAGGIGLFRSEFLFLTGDAAPSEEAQYEVYRQAAEAMGDRELIIRTLDIGADKQAPYLDLPAEANPALGLRGIRLCLARPELFKTQLRAILRASARGCVRIMFPMITSVWEFERCRDYCREVMAELDARGLPYDHEIRLGVMIETPAAALIAEDLAREADFFSIGTNDLTQYLLACDRQSGELEAYRDPHHPALLAALAMTAQAAHRAGIPVGICGELAADESLLETFLDLGIDELSMAPAAILPLRARLRSL